MLVLCSGWLPRVAIVLPACVGVIGSASLACNSLGFDNHASCTHSCMQPHMWGSGGSSLAHKFSLFVFVCLGDWLPVLALLGYLDAFVCAACVIECLWWYCLSICLPVFALPGYLVACTCAAFRSGCLCLFRLGICLSVLALHG